MDSEEKSCPSRGELAKAGRRCLRHVVLRCPEPVVCSSKGVAALGSVAQLPHYALGRGLETVTPAILFTVNFRIFFDFFDRGGGSPNFKIKKKNPYHAFVLDPNWIRTYVRKALSKIYSYSNGDVREGCLPLLSEIMVDTHCCVETTITNLQ